MTSALASIDLQIMWSRLIAIVEEQAQTLIRTAFSTSVREAGDLSAGIFDPQGRMLAQAVTGTPGHVNAMAESVGHFISAIGRENMRQGDVYLTNDPWKGTGHLHDITAVSPVIYDARLIGFFASTAHVVDIGGRGFTADAREVYEEGLFIPIMRLIDRGEVNRDLINIVLNNVREADKVVGDLYSLAACNETGIKRLIAMLAEFALPDLEKIASEIAAVSGDAMRRALAVLPQGEYENSLTVDGYDEPITLRVVLKIGPDGIVADFAGSSPTSPYGINVPLIYTKAYACYALKCVVAPEVPNNAASLAFFGACAPAGCILNAIRPAPVSLRHVLGHFVPDLVLGALATCLPDKIPAEGAGSLWNLHLSSRGDDAAERDGGFEILMFNSGGGGARPGLDGMSATAFPSGVRTMAVEATEHTGPIVVWRKELRPDSGGPGRHRGGLGQKIEIGTIDGRPFSFSAMFDRIGHPARGRQGGATGAAGSVALDDGTPLGGKGMQSIPAGRRLVLNLPGGGGFGPPGMRDAEALARDMRNGYVTPGQARAEYGFAPSAQQEEAADDD